MRDAYLPTFPFPGEGLSLPLTPSRGHVRCLDSPAGGESFVHFPPLGRQGSIFACFLVAPERHRKIKFFRLPQKSIKMENKWTLGAPRLHF